MTYTFSVFLSSLIVLLSSIAHESSLRGIARSAQVSGAWLQDYVNRKFDLVPRHITVSAKSNRRLIIECDEMWSFVLSKYNEVYIWLAIDRDTREIVGCFVGNRTRKSARKLWASLPKEYPLLILISGNLI